MKQQLHQTTSLRTRPTLGLKLRFTLGSAMAFALIPTMLLIHRHHAYVQQHPEPVVQEELYVPPVLDRPQSAQAAAQP
ncbi:MAG: hypothetical protein SF053_03755 [Bacteroidia bacterium]|nr:hypothetical protein [Bacteroidia bacterium]